jgi:hypothetical protein
MQTLLYTDTDQVRSVLGLSSKDLDDAQLVSRKLDTELKLDLVSWLPTHAALYATGNDVGAADADKNIADALVMFSTYFCAGLVGMSLPLGAPQSISDGKNSMARFTPHAWQELTSKSQERMSFYKNLLQELVSTATGAVTNYSQFAGVGLSIDPVTGA